MENVEFGLKIKGMDKTERRKIAQKYIDLVGLTGFEKCLSGSAFRRYEAACKHRQGLFYMTRHILLMDEPFGAQ